MQAERWKQIEELYLAALLRAEVQSFIAHQADSFLESAPLSAVNALTAGRSNFEIVGCSAAAA
jgi:hypothetical protein